MQNANCKKQNSICKILNIKCEIQQAKCNMHFKMHPTKQRPFANTAGFKHMLLAGEGFIFLRAFCLPHICAPRKPNLVNKSTLNFSGQPFNDAKPVLPVCKSSMGHHVTFHFYSYMLIYPYQCIHIYIYIYIYKFINCTYPCCA